MKYYSIIDQRGQLAYPVGNNICKAIEYVNRVVKTIVSLNLLDKIDSLNIWCRGSSGSILAALLADKLIAIGKHVCIVHVKKPNEKAHCNSIDPEYTYNIIIDDLISSGDTVRSIANAMYLRDISKIDMLIVSTGGINLRYVGDLKYEIGRQHIPFPEIMLDSTIMSNSYLNQDKLFKQVNKIKTTNLDKYHHDITD